MEVINGLLKMTQNIFFVLFSLTLLKESLSSKVVLKDNGYENVVIALDSNLPVTMCQDIILGLEVSLKKKLFVFVIIFENEFFSST